MKRKYFNGKAALSNTIRIGCTAALCMLPVQVFAGAEAPAETAAAEPEPASNWIDFTVGGVALSGDEGAFQHRTGTNGDFYGGISSMHWEKEANDITWTLDGHALFGNEDYEFILGAEKADLGYVEAGFRQFRTWYDATGGYDPRSDEWYPVLGESHSLYRGEAWLEAGLRMEDLPEITFRYSHAWRSGDKDSTMWNTGGAYKIVPGMYDIDEKRDTFELDVAYTLGNTDLGLGLVYENVSNDDTRVEPKFDGTTGNVQRDVYDSDLFSAHAFSSSRLNDRMLLSFGYSFTTMDTDTDGTERVGSWSIPSGGGEYQASVVNANFWWNPIDDLVVVPSIRAEWEDLSSVSNFTKGAALTPGAMKNDSNYDSLTEQLEVRYSGLENILFYGKALFGQEQGDIDYYEYNSVGGLRNKRVKDADTNQWKASIGANWYPMSGLSFATEYYHRNLDVDYDNSFTTDGTGSAFHVGDLHINSHNIDTDDFSLRMTWRAMPNLTLVSRYDYQESSYDTKGFDGFNVLPNVESADVTRNIFSQSATWTIREDAYLQGSVSYVKAQTDTPADNQVPTNMTDCDNDYLTANLIVGYAIDQKTDVTAGYSYYYANDYEVPLTGNGYGTDLQENVFTVRLNRQINSNMAWNLGYAYYTSNDGTSGGNNDFDAHVVSTGLQIRF